MAWAHCHNCDCIYDNPPWVANSFLRYVWVYYIFWLGSFLQVKEASYTRLCSTKKILTVNGLFPGPAIYMRRGDRLKVNVRNAGEYNVTIHWYRSGLPNSLHIEVLIQWEMFVWSRYNQSTNNYIESLNMENDRHGVKQPRNPWSDGPNYVTQCPIKPGANFTYEIILSNEEGTIWWHAHSDWSRATVHGPLIVLPKLGKGFPFVKPHKAVPIVLGKHPSTSSLFI